MPAGGPVGLPVGLEYGIPVPPEPGVRVAFAHGAAVTPAWEAVDVAAAVVGWFAMWMDVCGTEASGSISHEKSEPKGKCCTTGNFARTSALNIFIMPCP